MLSSALMLLVTILMQWKPELLVMAFTDEAEVIEVGAVFLQLISLNFIAQGIVFSSSGVFQGLGNTRPAMISSMIRVLVFLPLAVYLKYQPGFHINQVWYVSILSVTAQAVAGYVLVRREFRLRLDAPAAVNAGI
jgi:Na+-driven multidrug efflux pump